MKLIAPGLIRLSNGEELPKPLQGKYTAVPGESNLYRITFPLCVYHDIIQHRTRCKRIVPQEHCNLKDILISPSICERCDERKSSATDSEN